MRHRATHPRDAPTIALAAIVIVGIALRFAQYASGRSLWHDEALLSLNLVGRSLSHAVGRLDFAQAAPWPFMAAEWTIARVLGYSEASLRLVPLAAGISSLVLFAVLARRRLSPWVATIATLFFAVADGLVYYAAELKPYSSDVLVTVILLLLGSAAVDRPVTTRRALAIGLGGAIAIVWSFPAVFVSSSTVVVLLVPGRRERWRQTVVARLPVVAMWLLATASVVVNAHFRVATVRSEFELDPGAFGSSEDGGDGLNFDWLDRFASVLLHTLGLAQDRPLSHAGKVVLVVGAIGFLSLARRRASLAALLGLPFAATLLASRLDLYPITERTTLFLLPCLALILAEGVWWPSQRLRPHVGAAISVALGTAIMVFPVYSAAYHVVHPRTKEEVRPVLAALLREWRPGDRLYVHPGAQYAFRYYAECDCLPGRPGLGVLLPFDRAHGASSSAQAIEPMTDALVIGSTTTEPAVVRRDLANVHGRVWFLASHADSVSQKDFIDVVVPRVLDELGTRMAKVERPGATAYLYVLP